MITDLSVCVHVVAYDKNEKNPQLEAVRKVVKTVRDNLDLGSKLVIYSEHNDVTKVVDELDIISGMGRQVILLTNDPLDAQKIFGVFWAHEKEVRGLDYEKNPFTCLGLDDYFIDNFKLIIQYFSIYSKHYWKTLSWSQFNQANQDLVSTIEIYRETMWNYVKVRLCLGFKLSKEEDEFAKGYGLHKSERKLLSVINTIKF